MERAVERSVAWREGKLNAVIGEHGMDLVRNGRDQCLQEARRGGSPRLPDNLDEGEFARAINGDIEIELALGGLDLCDIDVDVADRVGLELLSVRLVTHRLWQPRNAMAPQAAVQ
jgi:hypothetical protein